MGYNNSIISTPMPMIVPYSTPSTNDKKNVLHRGNKSISERKWKECTINMLLSQIHIHVYNISLVYNNKFIEIKIIYWAQRTKLCTMSRANSVGCMGWVHKLLQHYRKARLWLRRQICFTFSKKISKLLQKQKFIIFMYFKLQPLPLPPTLLFAPSAMERQKLSLFIVFRKFQVQQQEKISRGLGNYALNLLFELFSFQARWPTSL